MEGHRDEPTLRGRGSQTGPAAPGRDDPEVNKRRQAILSQDSLERVQIELRVYSMYAQTRFEDRGVDQMARHLADNECENALRRFNEMVVNGGRSSIRIRPASACNLKSNGYRKRSVPQNYGYRRGDHERGSPWRHARRRSFSVSASI